MLKPKEQIERAKRLREQMEVLKSGRLIRPAKPKSLRERIEQRAKELDQRNSGQET